MNYSKVKLHIWHLYICISSLYVRQACCNCNYFKEVIVISDYDKSDVRMFSIPAFVYNT